MEGTIGELDIEELLVFQEDCDRSQSISEFYRLRLLNYDAVQKLQTYWCSDLEILEKGFRSLNTPLAEILNLIDPLVLEDKMRHLEALDEEDKLTRSQARLLLILQMQHYRQERLELTASIKNIKQQIATIDKMRAAEAFNSADDDTSLAEIGNLEDTLLAKEELMTELLQFARLNASGWKSQQPEFQKIYQDYVEGSEQFVNYYN